MLNDYADQVLLLDHPEVKVINLPRRFRTLGPGEPSARPVAISEIRAVRIISREDADLHPGDDAHGVPGRYSLWTTRRVPRRPRGAPRQRAGFDMKRKIQSDAAAALASHDLLFVWDDDDVYLPHRLSFSVAHFDPGKGFFKAHQAWFWNDGELSGPVVLQPHWKHDYPQLIADHRATQ